VDTVWEEGRSHTLVFVGIVSRCGVGGGGGCSGVGNDWVVVVFTLGGTTTSSLVFIVFTIFYRKVSAEKKGKNPSLMIDLSLRSLSHTHTNQTHTVFVS
jgi:hypothetical protein